MVTLEVGHVVRDKNGEQGLVRYLRDPNTVTIMWDTSILDTDEKPGDFEVRVREGRRLVWKPAAPTVSSKFF